MPFSFPSPSLSYKQGVQWSELSAKEGEENTMVQGRIGLKQIVLGRRKERRKYRLLEKMQKEAAEKAEQKAEKAEQKAEQKADGDSNGDEGQEPMQQNIETKTALKATPEATFEIESDNVRQQRRRMVLRQR